MKLPSEYLDETVAEFADAADWYEQQRPGLGAEFSEAVLGTVDFITRHPRIFAVERRQTRSAPVAGFPLYRVYYRIRRTHVEIVAVFNTARDPRELTRRKK